MSARQIVVEHNGTTYYGEVMRIKSTRLGQEDHGIFSAMLHCEGDGSGIGLGGYALDSWSESAKNRIGSAYGTDHLLRIMHTAGVDRWEKLPGTDVLVLFEKSGSWGLPAVGFAHIRDEKRVLIFKEHADSWRERESEAVA